MTASAIFLFVVITVAKCRICGTNLKNKEAYRVSSFKNNKLNKEYYCSREEYDAEQSKKKNSANQSKPKRVTDVDRDNAYRLICEIIGRKKIENTILWKEWQIWNGICSNKLIWQYLAENKEFLIGAVSKIDNIEFNRIRYLSAILKNNLGDFVVNRPEDVASKPKIQVEETIYESQSINSATRSNKRRSLADLEDEY